MISKKASRRNESHWGCAVLKLCFGLPVVKTRHIRKGEKIQQIWWPERFRRLMGETRMQSTSSSHNTPPGRSPQVKVLHFRKA